MIDVTDAQVRSLIRERRRALLAVRGRQSQAGAWLPLFAILATAAAALVLRLHS